MDTKKDITIKDLRIFSLVLALILVLLSVKFSKALNVTAGGILLILSIASFLIGILSPVLIIPVYKIFLLVEKVIGNIVTALLLCVVFYCIFTPIGVVLKILKKDILGLKIDKGSDTYWTERKEKTIRPETLKNQF